MKQRDVAETTDTNQDSTTGDKKPHRGVNANRRDRDEIEGEEHEEVAPTIHESNKEKQEEDTDLVSSGLKETQALQTGFEIITNVLLAFFVLLWRILRFLFGFEDGSAIIAHTKNFLRGSTPDLQALKMALDRNEIVRSEKDGHLFYCLPCQLHLRTKNASKSHLESEAHKKRVGLNKMEKDGISFTENDPTPEGGNLVEQAFQNNILFANDLCADSPPYWCTLCLKPLKVYGKLASHLSSVSHMKKEHFLVIRMADILNVEWNNHVPTILYMLSALRSMEKYTDATLTCDGRFYGVHKLVLASCSDYFMNIFEKTPCKHPVIVLKDIKEKEMMALLNYMYNGVVSIAESDLSKFIAAAELLQIKGLAAPDEPPPAKERGSLSLLPSSDTSVPVQTNTAVEVHPPDNTQNATKNPTPDKRAENGNEDDVIVITDVEEVAQRQDRNSCNSRVKVLPNQHVEEEEEVEVVSIDDPQTSDGNLTERRNSSGKKNVVETRLSDGDEDALAEQQCRPEMVAKRKSHNKPSPNKKIHAGKSTKLDWSKCCLCQGDGENLQWSVKGFRHLATQLPLFHALGKTALLPVEDFKGDELFTSLFINNARYHTSCYNNYSASELKCLKNPAKSLGESENFPGRKRKNVDSGKLTCYLCRKPDCVKNLKPVGKGKRARFRSAATLDEHLAELYYHESCDQNIESNVDITLSVGTQTK